MIAQALLGALCFACGVAACLLFQYRAVKVVMGEWDNVPDEIEHIVREVEKSTAG